MREIIFRGKRLDNGEWAEGFYISHLNAFHYIIPFRTGGYEAMDNSFYVHKWFEVDHSTIGQYTGLKDKHGNRIFEGDILLLDDINGIVNYGTGCFCVELPGPDYLYRNNPAIDMVLNEYPGLEIIGNIHDNPELIKKEAQP